MQRSAFVQMSVEMKRSRAVILFAKGIYHWQKRLLLGKFIVDNNHTFHLRVTERVVFAYMSKHMIRTADRYVNAFQNHYMRCEIIEIAPFVHFSINQHNGTEHIFHRCTAFNATATRRFWQKWPCGRNEFYIARQFIFQWIALLFTLKQP